MAAMGSGGEEHGDAVEARASLDTMVSVTDLTTLAKLDEAEILEVLESRFQTGEIYTHAGPAHPWKECSNSRFDVDIVRAFV